MTALLTAIWWILYESSPYLIAGFALAGLFHVLFDRASGLTRRLAGGGVGSVLWAACVGLPMPLCSCSVLPAALTLRRKGARPGAMYSFLVSVPETDVVSILQTNALIGPLMAVLRPLAALITAVATGILANVMERWTGIRRTPTAPASQQPGEPPGPPPCGCEHEHGPASELIEPAAGEDQPGHAHAHGDQPMRHWVRRAADYGFVEFFDDIIPSLLLGVVLGGLIAVALPRIGLDRFAGGSFIALAAMLLVAMPMYVCASASTPMAVGMITGGVSPGAALVFLLAGPATNVASVLVLTREMGRRSVALYLTCVAVISLGMGLALDAAIAREWVRLPVLQPPTQVETASILKTASACALLLWSLASFSRTHLLRTLVDRAASRTGWPLTVPRVGAAALVLLAAWYGASGFFCVPAGSRGLTLLFGRITQEDLAPGLHFNWPYPFGDRRVVALDRVRRVELGFRSQQEEMVQVDPSRDPYLDESWILTGNEDLIDIRWTVQYRPGDGPAALRQFAFGVADADELVRAAAEAAIREVVAGRSIDRLLTEERDEVERRVREDGMAPLLASWGAGVQVVDVRLVDVHAPSPVHPAFRDVASASEQKQGMINLALDAESTTLSRARSGAIEAVESARGKAAQISRRCIGDTVLFQARREGFALNPAVARTEAYLARMDGVLPRLKKYVSLVASDQAQLDLWLTAAGAAKLPPAPPDDRD